MLIIDISAPQPPPSYIPVGAVVKHFEDFHEDQFDFHQYCIRKVTLRAYVEVLRWEDKLWGEDYYFSAAEGIIRIYLRISDDPSVLDGNKEPDYSTMTAAERKKAKAIARKKKKAAEKKDEEDGKRKGNLSPIDEDPEGKELLKLDPLAEAQKYSSILSRHCPKKFCTWELQYDVAIRRRKWLPALQALCKMKALNPNSAGFASRLIDFALKVPTLEDVSDLAQKVLDEVFPQVLEKGSAKKFVVDAVANIRNGKVVDLPFRVAIAKGLVQTGVEGEQAAAELIVDGGLDTPGICVDSCIAALETIKKFGSVIKKDCAGKWISMVQERYPALSLPLH